jgi:hypothetical protein
MRKRLITWGSAAAAAAALAFVAWPPEDQPSPGPRQSIVAAAPDRDDLSPQTSAGPRLGSMPERTDIGRPRADLFAPRSWSPPAPAPVAQPAPAPAAPALPYKFAGKLVQDGAEQLFLSKGNVVLPVREGDTLDGAYRVESIDANRITLLYLPLGTRETISVSSAIGVHAQSAAKPFTPSVARAQGATQAAGPTPAEQTGTRSAQLRWEGPQNVQAGASFNVALRMTSAQPVRASPLQLRFDAHVLEPVSVRPGKFFGSRNDAFSYRISPDGAIFVGVSGQGGAAADAELLVLTFKPIRSGTTAEVKVSALNLQGTTGRPIAYEQLAAFRTAVAR